MKLIPSVLGQDSLWLVLEMAQSGAWGSSAGACILLVPARSTHTYSLLYHLGSQWLWGIPSNVGATQEPSRYSG
jgi:hypothetical protein